MRITFAVDGSLARRDIPCRPSTPPSQRSMSAPVAAWGPRGDARYAMTGGRSLGATFLVERAPLLRYLRARGAGEEAEDLLQELWVKLEAGHHPQVDQPRAYLMRMAHNLMLDRLRAASRRRTREAAYHETDDEADVAPPVVRVLLARERLRNVDHVLAGLGERTNLIFRRHRVDEVPQREIATEFGISLSAVEKHLQKAYRAVAAARATDAASGEEADG